MKYLKYGIIGLLIWELLVLSTKDKSFKKKLKQTDKTKKVQTLFEELLAFNKDILSMIKESDFQSWLKKVDESLQKREKNILDLIWDFKFDEQESTKIDNFVNKIKSVFEK